MGSKYILAHTGPRELDGHPLGGCGSGFGLVPGYTTLSVRVRANIKFGAFKIKSVRTRTGKVTLFRREVQRVSEILSIKSEYLTQKKERERKPSPGRARVLHVTHTRSERKRGGLVQPST